MKDFHLRIRRKSWYIYNYMEENKDEKNSIEGNLEKEKSFFRNIPPQVRQVLTTALVAVVSSTVTIAIFFVISSERCK